jgi:hypothetical protein
MSITSFLLIPTMTMHDRRDCDRGPELPEMMGGLPLAAWRAEIDATSDLERLRRLALAAVAQLEALHAAAREQGADLPRKRRPTKSTRESPR